MSDGSDSSHGGEYKTFRQISRERNHLFISSSSLSLSIYILNLLSVDYPDVDFENFAFGCGGVFLIRRGGDCQEI